jgi:hypothetical protein
MCACSTWQCEVLLCSASLHAHDYLLHTTFKYRYYYQHTFALLVSPDLLIVEEKGSRDAQTHSIETNSAMHCLQNREECLRSVRVA